ncbi:hypothetical protein FQR65_LT15949 [Abscondita terminalis]|nr:hypothetical protein FQR65_LT15949 [Abscondita terminalis]
MPVPIHCSYNHQLQDKLGYNNQFLYYVKNNSPFHKFSDEEDSCVSTISESFPDLEIEQEAGSSARDRDAPTEQIIMRCLVWLP